MLARQSGRKRRAVWYLTCPVLALLLASLPAAASGDQGIEAGSNTAIVTPEEARAVAESWLHFIVERDGHWAGALEPAISEFTGLERGGSLLGYFAAVEPQGYVVVSLVKGFAACYPDTIYSCF